MQLFPSIFLSFVLIKFLNSEQSEVAKSSIEKSEEDDSSRVNQQISQDETKRKSQEEKDVKESTPEKETEPEKQVSKKDATDLIDTESKVTNDTLDTTSALVNAVITNKNEVDEGQRDRRVGTSSNDKSTCPSASLINALTDNKISISNSDTVVEETKDEAMCDNDMISQVSSHTKTLEEDDKQGDVASDDAEPNGNENRSRKNISITEESLVRESSTDVEPEDVLLEDAELDDEVKAELDKLDVFLDDEENNVNSSESNEGAERRIDDKQHDTDLVSSNDTIINKDELQDDAETTEDVHEEQPTAVENDTPNEGDTFIEKCTTEGTVTQDDDPALVVVPGDDVDSGSECQVGLEGCTFACLHCGTSIVRQPSCMWMD